MSHSEDTNEIRSRRAEFPPGHRHPRRNRLREASSTRAAPLATSYGRNGDNINSILDKISGNTKIDTTEITAQYL